MYVSETLASTLQDTGSSLFATRVINILRWGGLKAIRLRLVRESKQTAGLLHVLTGNKKQDRVAELRAIGY